MKINFILPALNMSGGSKVICIYADELKRLGHSVTIVSQPSHVAPLKDKVRSLIRGNGWPIIQPKTHLDGKDVEHRILETNRPVVDSDVPDGDVVIATWWETAEWVSALSPSKGRKVYFIQHHEVFPHLPARSRETYKLPLRKIVIARWLKDLMASEYGDTGVDLVPNSVDRYQFYSPPRTKQAIPTVGVLYSTVAFKGLDVSLSAIEMLRLKIPNLRTISFGSERRKSRFPLPKGSEFYLLPRQDQLRELYSECDVWLTASRSEGFNLPALEAMACGTPVVSTRAGWPAEGVVDRVNGILTEVDDTASLSEAMEWILTLSDWEWEQLSQAAYQTMTTGSWRESAKMFEASLLAA